MDNYLYSNSKDFLKHLFYWFCHHFTKQLVNDSNLLLFQMGFALFFNILAVIISAVASVVLIIFTSLVSEVIDYSNRHGGCQTVGDMCQCRYNDAGDEIDCKYKYKNVKRSMWQYKSIQIYCIVVGSYILKIHSEIIAISTTVLASITTVRKYSTGNMNCDDLDTLRTIIIVVLIVYIILTVTTFIASIFGCMGTCCAPVVSNT